jgi:hypothetical protein
MTTTDPPNSGIQKPKILICKDCKKTYLGHHLTKLCDECRFKECKAPDCQTKIKRSSPKRYCSDGCRLSDPQANKMPREKRKTTKCPCGTVFPRYSGSGRDNPGSRRKYCSDECEKKYYTRPPTSEEQKRKISEAKKGKPLLKLRGHKQTEDHLRKRLGNGTIRPSQEELSLVPTLARYGYRHCGDGTSWKRWPDGTNHNPDYINDEKRSVVEYFGFCWHEEEWGKEDYVRAQWKGIGYDCLILWDSDRLAFIEDPELWNIDLPASWISDVRHRTIPTKKGTSTWAARGQKKLKEPKTHCSRGHLLEKPNLRKRKAEWQECLACYETYLILRHQKDLDAQEVSDACYEEIVNGTQNPYRRTKQEAQQDRVKAGQHHSSAKTHCPLGHALQEPNLDPYFLRQGYRKCRSCDKARNYIRSHEGDKKEISDRFYRELEMGDPLDPV